MDTELRHPRFARVYPSAAARADRRGAAEHRRRLLHGLAGRVVEVGAGNGRNFVHYPPTVTEVVAIEPEPTLRALAGQAPAAVPVTVLGGATPEVGSSGVLTPLLVRPRTPRTSIVQSPGRGFWTTT